MIYGSQIGKEVENPEIEVVPQSIPVPEKFPAQAPEENPVPETVPEKEPVQDIRVWRSP